MRTKLAAAATSAVALLVLAVTGCATSSTTAPPGRTDTHTVPAVMTSGTHGARAVPEPGVEVVSDELNDGRGCVGIGYDEHTGEVDIPVSGTAAERCSATDAHLIHAVRVVAGGVGTLPGDRLPLTLLSMTAQPGERVVTGLAWRLPAGTHIPRGHMMHLIVTYRVSADDSRL